MGALFLTVFLCATGMSYGNVYENLFHANRELSKAMLEFVQDDSLDQNVLFDLKKENQVHLNRTMSLLIKYIVKREVDKYRSKRTDAISRRLYSSLVMKLIDIAKDLPRNQTNSKRIDTAHRYYMSVENKEEHDIMADNQVFHACVRLYEVLFTAPSILAQLGKLDDMTPRILIRKIDAVNIKPIHFGIMLLIQYHLRKTVNYAIRYKAIEVLSTRPQMVGPQVVEVLKGIAARLLPVSELLDLHLAHYSPVFKDTSPSTWLGIVKDS